MQSTSTQSTFGYKIATFWFSLERTSNQHHNLSHCRKSKTYSEGRGHFSFHFYFWEIFETTAIYPALRAQQIKNKATENDFHYHTSFSSREKLLWSRWLSCLYRLTTRKTLTRRITEKKPEHCFWRKCVAAEAYRNLKLLKTCTTARTGNCLKCAGRKFRAATTAASQSASPPPPASRWVGIGWAAKDNSWEISRRMLVTGNPPGKRRESAESLLWFRWRSTTDKSAVRFPLKETAASWVNWFQFNGSGRQKTRARQIPQKLIKAKNVLCEKNSISRIINMMVPNMS